LSLQPTGNKTSAPLDLIFSDVWGPTPMFSSNGFRYFVIFINVHWFSHKIKFVQTFWGGEYRKLNSFFQTIGIHHQLICPHTYEQNGSVECRHSHIVETGLTLLGQCSASL
jgi:histone deacetylase 1/2